MRRTLACLALFLAPCLGAAEVGQDLRALPLPLQAGPTTLEAFRGQVVYLDVWATWCPPCVKSMAWMSDLQKRMAERGLKVIAVSIDQKPDRLAAFLEQHRPGILIGHDPAAAIAKTLAAKAMPSAYLIDRKGRLRFVHQGFNPKDTPALEAELADLLKEE